ncbi:MAG TPA: hypothetical protein ENH55_01370 [Aurantimonas coralicida]|uniref:Uncharacterized protein n=2 Tax=root TaxID=1 RepID=A0A9C9NGT6_9HYPH|nr:hypothetical protein [Aurantimonas coralicida]HEU01226.1 hypothetical protein [Aurantimonas coralicida]
MKIVDEVVDGRVLEQIQLELDVAVMGQVDRGRAMIATWGEAVGRVGAAAKMTTGIKSDWAES